MKAKSLLVAAVVIAGFSSAFTQTVLITPKKTVYRRPKPQHDFKRTFTIRRPVAKAATVPLSRKITAAIDPEKVLDIRLKEELSEYQWLEEADYKVLFNRNGVLCLEFWMTGTAAYPDSVTKRVVVDVANGSVVSPSDVLKNLPALAKLVKKAQTAEVVASTAEMKSDTDARPELLFQETDFRVDDFREFSVDTNGVTFFYDYGFPHVLEALQPTGQFHFSWSQLRPFIRMDGLLARFVR